MNGDRYLERAAAGGQRQDVASDDAELAITATGVGMDGWSSVHLCQRSGEADDLQVLELSRIIVTTLEVEEAETRRRYEAEAADARGGYRRRESAGWGRTRPRYGFYAVSGAMFNVRSSQVGRLHGRLRTSMSAFFGRSLPEIEPEFNIRNVDE